MHNMLAWRLPWSVALTILQSTSKWIVYRIVGRFRWVQTCRWLARRDEKRIKVSNFWQECPSSHDVRVVYKYGRSRLVAESMALYRYFQREASVTHPGSPLSCSVVPASEMPMMQCDWSLQNPEAEERNRKMDPAKQAAKSVCLWAWQ